MINILSGLLTLILSITYHHGILASKGTYGAWQEQRVELADNAINTIVISASNNDIHTPINCSFIDPYSKVILVQKHTLSCRATVNGLSLPSHINIKFDNDVNYPVIYELEIVVSRQ